MKHLIAVLAAALLSTSAFAIGLGNDNPPSGGSSTNLNANTQGQSQGQGQLQAQGQLQGQGQAQFTNVDVSNRISNDVRNNAASFAAGGDSRSNSVSGANSVSQGGASGASATSGGSTSGVNFQVEYPRMVGALGLGSLYPTAPCMGTSNIGGGNGFFTFGAGTSWTDDECGIRETSRSFNGMGLKDDALKVLCSSKYAAVAPSCAQAKAE